MTKQGSPTNEAQILAWRRLARITRWSWYVGWIVAIALIAWEQPIVGVVLALLSVGQWILFWWVDGMSGSGEAIAKLEKGVDERFVRVREGMQKDYDSLARWAGDLQRQLSALESRLDGTGSATQEDHPALERLTLGGTDGVNEQKGR